jgi:hypothetical protein
LGSAAEPVKPRQFSYRVLPAEASLRAELDTCGLSRRSISEKLRRYQIDKADFKTKVGLRKEVALVDPA